MNASTYRAKDITSKEEIFVCITEEIRVYEAINLLVLII